MINDWSERLGHTATRRENSRLTSLDKAITLRLFLCKVVCEIAKTENLELLGEFPISRR